MRGSSLGFSINLLFCSKTTRNLAEEVFKVRLFYLVLVATEASVEMLVSYRYICVHMWHYMKGWQAKASWKKGFENIEVFILCKRTP